MRKMCIGAEQWQTERSKGNDLNVLEPIRSDRGVGEKMMQYRTTADVVQQLRPHLMSGPVEIEITNWHLESFGKNQVMFVTGVSVVAGVLQAKKTGT